MNEPDRAPATRTKGANLRETLRQERPFASPEQAAYLGVVRTAAELTAAMDQVLRGAGITGPQYNVLRILRGAPAGLCRNDVRDRMLTRMPDMTRMLDRMEAAGLVERSRSAEDRRMMTTHITAAGLRILEQLEEPVANEHRRSLGPLGPERLGALIALLDDVRQSAGPGREGEAEAPTGPT
jgi:DNA-binding MarR family transcriptional regulator